MGTARRTAGPEQTEASPVAMAPLDAESLVKSITSALQQVGSTLGDKAKPTDLLQLGLGLGLGLGLQHQQALSQASAGSPVKVMRVGTSDTTSKRPMSAKTYESMSIARPGSATTLRPPPTELAEPHSVTPTPDEKLPEVEEESLPPIIARPGGESADLDFVSAKSLHTAECCAAPSPPNHRQARRST